MDKNIPVPSKLSENNKAQMVKPTDAKDNMLDESAIVYPVSTSDQDISKYRRMIYIFGFVFIVFALIFAYMMLSGVQNNNAGLEPSDNPKNNYNEVLYVPKNIGKHRVLQGRISKSFVSSYQYQIENEEGEVASYLVSVGQDLSLMVGFSAEIEGDMIGNYNGLDVVEVKSIRLK